MFRAANHDSISNPVTPPVFTGTIQAPNSKCQASRNLDRGHWTFGHRIRHASVDQLHRAHEVVELQSRDGAVTFPATAASHPIATPPGTAEHNEGGNDD